MPITCKISNFFAAATLLSCVDVGKMMTSNGYGLKMGAVYLFLFPTPRSDYWKDVDYYTLEQHFGYLEGSIHHPVGYSFLPHKVDNSCNCHIHSAAGENEQRVVLVFG